MIYKIIYGENVDLEEHSWQKHCSGRSLMAKMLIWKIIYGKNIDLEDYLWQKKLIWEIILGKKL